MVRRWPRALLGLGLGLALWPAPPATAQAPAARTVLTGAEFEYVVRSGDTLGLISARFGAGITALAELNLVHPNDALRPGHVLRIDNRHLAVIDPPVQLIVNIAQRMLFLVEGERVSGFPVAVGVAAWPTPVGQFTIVDKEENPTWDVPRSIQEEMFAQGKPVIATMPPSPQNPLGAHWLRLSLPNIGIHGTIAPSSVYRYASHGCVRMHPDDVAFLFTRLAIGTAGAIIYRPLTIGLVGGRVFVEAHPDGYRRAPLGLAPLEAIAHRDGFFDRVDWPAVTGALRQRRGIAVDVTRDE